VKDGPTALYRYFDDKDRLLYVGISGNLGGRHKTHIGSSRWMDLMARSEVARYPTRAEASDAEIEAITTEQPLFNKQHNDTAEARAWLSAYLREIGRTDLEPTPDPRRLVPVQDQQIVPAAQVAGPSGDSRRDVVSVLGDVIGIIEAMQERTALLEPLVKHINSLVIATDYIAGQLMETRARLDEIERRANPAPPEPTEQAA
jgi:hypothetical protein